MTATTIIFDLSNPAHWFLLSVAVITIQVLAIYIEKTDWCLGPTFLLLLASAGTCITSIVWLTYNAL